MAELRAAVPELKQLLQDDSWAGVPPGLHILFADIVLLYVLPALQEPLTDTENLGQLFAFFERMASDGDPDLGNIVDVTIAAQLSDDKDAVARAGGLIGPLLQASIARADAFWRGGP